MGLRGDRSIVHFVVPHVRDVLPDEPSANSTTTSERWGAYHYPGVNA